MNISLSEGAYIGIHEDFLGFIHTSIFWIPAIPGRSDIGNTSYGGEVPTHIPTPGQGEGGT